MEIIKGTIITIAVTVAVILGMWYVRGYYAIGGEMIIPALVITYMAIRTEERNGEKEERHSRSRSRSSIHRR